MMFQLLYTHTFKLIHVLNYRTEIKNHAKRGDNIKIM